MKWFLVSFPLVFSLFSHADTPATHGMFLFGKQNLYVSHLPMFSMPVHRYQVILRVSVPKEAREKIDEALKEHKNSNPFLTIAPNKFDLPKQVAEKKPFLADIYWGHFEAEEKELLAEQVKFTIEDVLVNKPLKANDPQPADWSGFLFGQQDEAFLLHNITKRPNFDQIIALDDVGRDLGAKLSKSKALTVSVPGQSDKKQLPDVKQTLLLNGDKFNSEGTTLYVEFGELN